MTKNLYTTVLCTTFAILLLLPPTDVRAQSELFAENINKDFVANVQPELLKTVSDPKTTPYDFMIACKRLSVYGDAKAAAAVAKSLDIPERSLSARTALQAMPFPEALALLRDGLQRVADPVLKAGIIGSLGMRRDRDSIAILLPLLQSKQTVLVQAAMFALARIADPAYCDAMIALLGNTDFAQAKSIADLNLMYGEFLRLNGQAPVAHKVFLAVVAKAPRDYHKEAACFQMLQNDSPETRKLASQWLAGDDGVAFKATLRATRFVRSDAMTDILIQAYTQVGANRKPLILIALGDQRNPKGQATLVAALNSDITEIKEAAVVALKAYADHDSFNGLIAAAISGTPEVRRNSIAVIQMFDDNVNGDVLKLLKMDDAHKTLGVELIAARKIASGLADVFALAESGTASVRPAAVRALGDLATMEQFAWLVLQVVRRENAELSQAARDGLKTACGVIEDKTAAAEKLAAAADKLKDRPDDRL
ncbi:MAG: HEAT repeat domain-containing protein, partial [Thermoguttaceae bacterium]|nr:HEAT repeat domain-containing protein [Thermoguttaceae bacterium]